MRFLHIADLHLGKVIHGVSMLERGDQEHWVLHFLELARETRPDAVLIAGDVYDRGPPSGDAVELLSLLIQGLAAMDLPVLLVPGNHDSGQRLAFARDVLAKENVHIAGPLSRELQTVTLRDEYGPVTFWLLPYVFPALVSSVLEEELPRDYDAAVRRLLSLQPLNSGERNVLLAHQNVTAGGAEAERGGSESTVGGVGQIDWRCFAGFDDLGLGRIHAAGSVGRDTVRYAGSPLCYHFNETRQPEKGPVLVELGAKGELVRTQVLRIPPLHPMRELRGSFEELREAELASPRTNEYLRLVLTDRRLSPEISMFFDELFRARGSVLMDRCSEHDPFRADASAPASEAVESKSVRELFADFYAERSGGITPSGSDMELLAFAEELTRHARTDSAPGKEEAEKLLDFLMRQEARL